MKLATSTADLKGYFADDQQRHLEIFSASGFKYLDYSFYRAAEQGSPYIANNDLWKREITSIREKADQLGLAFVQAHAPVGTMFEAGEERDALIQAMLNSIEACAMLGIPCTVVHAGQHPDPDTTPADFNRTNLNFFQIFYAAAEKYQVNLLVENSCEQNAPRYYLRTGKEMKAFLTMANHPLLHACWDTGHANMRNMDQYESLVDLGDDLHAVHINDNFGDRDAHVMPYIGTCNFDQILLALRDIHYRGAFTLECGRGLRTHDAWPHVRPAFTYQGRPVNKLLDPSDAIVQRYMQLMYEVGKEMLKQYDLFDG